MPISPSSNLALIANGQARAAAPIAGELSYIEKNVVNIAGDIMTGDLTVPGLNISNSGGSFNIGLSNLLQVATDVSATVNEVIVNAANIGNPFLGMTLVIKVANTNNGPVTFILNGASAQNIYGQGSALPPNAIVAGSYIVIVWDGSNWDMINYNNNVFLQSNNFAGNNSFSGINTFSGNNNLTGNNAFSGNNTFSVANTFSGNNNFTGNNTFSGANSYSGEWTSLPSGTRMLFQQASVPPTWTQDTSVQNDSLLRMVNGAGGGVHGANGVSSVLWGNASTDGTAISVAQMPSHNHGVNDPGHAHTETYSPNTGTGYVSASAGSGYNNSGNVTTSNGTGVSIQYTGGNQAHSHTLSVLNINTIDIIVGVKN